MVGPILVAFALAQAPASACGVSDEPAYATTKERPVQVGGGVMSVAARARRYLDALRGPMGEAIQYKRIGSLRPDRDGRTILDTYEVTYPGLERPIVFYLDGYHFDDGLKAPKGFTCAVPIGLSAPPPDGMLAQESLLQLAIEQGAARDIAPISLDADGSSAHGILIDHFRIVARASRTASAAGTPIDAKAPPVELIRARMVVVAYPLRCGDKEVSPASIEIVAAQGQPPRRDGELATGAALARLLPGMNVPAGAMAGVFNIDRPRATDAIRIAYPEGACGAANEARLAMTYTNAKPLQTPAPPLPAGHSAAAPPVIRLQALIDLDGAARTIVYIGGPAALLDAAVGAVRGWTAEPARLNGSPIVTPVTLQVKFGS